jgi:hypothetical protein
MKYCIWTFAFLAGIMVTSCSSELTNKQKNNSAPNLEELESQFIQQIILDDTLFDGFVVMESTRQIGFDHLNFNTHSSLNAELNCVQSGEIINLSDSDLFLLFKQCRVNQCYSWKPGKFLGHEILKDKVERQFSDTCSQMDVEYYWEMWHQTFGTGRLECSRPLFYDNGHFAIFDIKASWDYCKGICECCIYKNVNGKWERLRMISWDIIC